MSAPSATVADLRAARYVLASSLLELGRDASEAAGQLQQALREPGDEPPEWALRLLLARALLAQDEPQAAFAELVAAAALAPEAEAEGVAVTAAQLMSTTSQALHRAARSDDVDALLCRARAAERAPALVDLGVRLAQGRGLDDVADELRGAGPLCDERSERPERSGGRYDEAVRLLGDGDAAGALAAIGDRPDDDPRAPLLRVAARYVAGHAAEAASLLEGLAPSYEISVLRSLVLLQRAAAAGLGEERRRLAREALDVATAAVGLAPGRPEASLLRAQAMLEGALDLDEGRHLLVRGMRKLDGQVESLRWWRLQRLARRDDVHDYFRQEMAAATQRHRDVLSIARQAKRVTTDFLQDAASSELQARAWEVEGDARAAAQSYRSAAQAYRQLGHRLRAVTLLRRVMQVEPSLEDALLLAELLWESSFDTEYGGDGDGDAPGAGLAVLDAVEGSMTGQRAASACYLRGLLLSRLAGVAAGADAAQRSGRAWAPLPFLLAAQLADPTAAYVAGHLAWALSDAGLRLAALHFAEAAFDLLPDDAWLTETVITARSNWHGVIGADTVELLERVEPPEWRSPVLVSAWLLAGEHASVRTLAREISWDAPWSQQIKAQAIGLTCGVDEAFPLFAALLKDPALESSPAPADAVIAIEVAVALGDLALARERLAAGVRDGRVSAASGELYEALLRVLRREAGAVTTCSEALGRIVRPALLRDLAEVQLPLLLQAHRHDLELKGDIATLATVARQRLTELPDDPPLDVELPTGAPQGVDPDLADLVRALLRTAYERRDGSEPAQGRLSSVRVTVEDGRQALGTALAGLDAHP